jgi:hypothetical protein
MIEQQRERQPTVLEHARVHVSAAHLEDAAALPPPPHVLPLVAPARHLVPVDVGVGGVHEDARAVDQVVEELARVLVTVVAQQHAVAMHLPAHKLALRKRRRTDRTQQTDTE